MEKMFLLDTSGGVGATERIESSSSGGGGSDGTPPQKKTVYRISLTLVKRESLDEEPPRQLRREGSVELQRGGGGGGGLLEQLQEVDESDERALVAAASRGHMRNFRTFSTGQLELGRLKVSRKLLLLQEKKAEEKDRGGGVKEDTSPTEVTAVQNGSVAKRRFLKAKSVEEATSDPKPKLTHSKSNGKVAAPTEMETPSPKRPAGLLRRSFSFRHWSGGGGGGSELLRLRALAKDRHHSSSGSIETRQDTKVAANPAPPSPLVAVAPPTTVAAVATPTRQKSRTLETGAVLRKTDSLSELSRKTRTLDNSDLQRLGGVGGGGGAFLLRGGTSRSSERRLVRFFSGIFSRGGGAPSPGSPSPEQRPLQRSTRRVLSQSSCESVDGGGAQGTATPTTTTPPP